MGCSRCNKKRHTPPAPQPAVASVDSSVPFNVTDIQVVDHNEVRPLQDSDWPVDKHKLLIFYPETFTPICGSELGALNEWLPAFAGLDCVVIAVCSDQAAAIQDWYAQEPALTDLDALTFSSYLLPARLGLVDGGRAKRTSVFVTKDQEIIKQECFQNVGRSFEELHRQLYAYTTGEYCAAGWQSPADGFLTPPSA